MEHVTWADDADLERIKNPVTVLAFTGWNDAGDAASTALATLADASNASLVATIDPEIFTDFATVRPAVQLDRQRQRHIEWPTVQVYAAQLPGTDVIMIIGPEPALRWRLFSEQVTAVCKTVGSRFAISLGALLADVPHTRPSQVIGTSDDAAIIERYDLQQNKYEGPTGIVGVVGDALRNADIATASLWAAVPGYAAQIPSPPAAVSLIERVCHIMGTPPPTHELSEEFDDYREQVELALGDDDDLAIYIERLESMADDDVDDVEGATPPRGIVAGDPDVLAAEVEQFLRDRDD